MPESPLIRPGAFLRQKGLNRTTVNHVGAWTGKEKAKVSTEGKRPERMNEDFRCDQNRDRLLKSCRRCGDCPNARKPLVSARLIGRLLIIGNLHPTIPME
jgi:hypothetical protein